MRLQEQLKNDLFFKFDNWWFDEELILKYNYYAIIIYCYLSKHLTMRNEFTFTLNYIYSLFNIPSNEPTRQNQIKSALSAMQEDGLLISDTDYSTIKRTDYIITTVEKIAESFVVVYDFEFDTIMECKEKVDKSKLLTLFIYIKKGINSTSRITFPSYATLCKVCGIASHNTIKSYIDILRELGLLLYHTRDYRICNDGQIKKFPNVYTMNYEGYQQSIDKYNSIQDDKEKEYNDKMNKKKEANKKRSETMKKKFGNSKQ